MTKPKSSPALDLVRAECTAFPNLPTRTLARKVYAARPELWPSFEACYLMVRYARGNRGKFHRHKASHPRPNGAAGFKWVFPKSRAEKWEPVRLDAERTLILSDIHIPFHAPLALRALVKDARRWNPDCILLNGDVCDFFSISRFDKNPSKSALKDEIKLTRQFLGWLRQQFPRARLIYKFGNHDEWFSKYIWRKAPELWGLPQLELPHMLTQALDHEPAIGGIEFLTEQEKISIGHLDILHGHELGKGSIAPPVNPARGFFLKTMECTLAGHLHRTSQHQERTSKGKHIACWSTGCLCGLWPDYAKINKWDQSAARVDLHRGDFNVIPLRLIDGKLV